LIEIKKFDQAAGSNTVSTAITFNFNVTKSPVTVRKLPAMRRILSAATHILPATLGIAGAAGFCAYNRLQEEVRVG